MAVVNKDSRFPPLYDDPYEEPSVSLASTPSADLPVRDASQTSSNQDETLLSVNGTIDIPDNRPPGDGASARRDMPPLSVAPSTNDDNDDGDETFHSPCAEEASAAPSLPPPPLFPRGVPENSSVGNYDEPWDLTSKFRQLEEKFRAVPKLGQAAVTPAVVPRPHSQSSEDTRVLADGYDRPWDLQPHRRDERDDVGYDKPWDLKPHEKDVRASVAAPGDYDAPWDIKPRSIIERDVIAAKSAKEAAAGRLVSAASGQRSAVPHSSSSSSSDVAAQLQDAGRQLLQQYDEPWDQKQKQLVGKVAASELKNGGKSPAIPRPAAPPPSPPVAEKFDPRIPLQQQSWYHGSISRIEAEKLLRVHREGSYLVRTSESNRQDYSLSVKSSRGFMHMKIATETSESGTVRYILGQFSQPFSSVPQMIHHYTVSKLPVKGAEHMCLLYPVSHELL